MAYIYIHTYMYHHISSQMACSIQIHHPFLCLKLNGIHTRSVLHFQAFPTSFNCAVFSHLLQTPLDPRAH